MQNLYFVFILVKDQVLAFQLQLGSSSGCKPETNFVVILNFPPFSTSSEKQKCMACTDMKNKRNFVEAVYTP